VKFPEQFRWKEGPAPMYRSNEGDDFGFFIVPPHLAQKNDALKIMATAGMDGEGEQGNWEHVSVSLRDDRNKCPRWEAMCFVKDLFWEPDACVVQFHPPSSSYINQHKGCLHLWRSKVVTFPMPPTICV